MHVSRIIGAYSALLSVAVAVPLAKRDIVWVTDVVEDVVTVPVTTTVWLRPGQLAPMATSSSTHFGHHHHHSTASNAAPTQQVTNLPPPAASAPAPSASPADVSPVTTPAAPAVTPTTSVFVAPVPTTPVTPATPAPQTTESPTTAASAPVASSAASGSSGSGSFGGAGLANGPASVGKSYTGDLTWYQTGMGACGWTNTATEPIVAVSHVIFDAYSALDGGDPNNNPVCGKYVTITGKDGSSYQAKVVDRCVGCAISDLDLSEDFFNTVTDNGNGRVGDMSWSFA